MKNSEEDILKRFLQDTFSDYEPEPNDLTWENIRKEVQPQQPNVVVGFKHRIISVVALLLLIGGIAFNEVNTENETEMAMNGTRKISSNEKQVTNYQKKSSQKLIKLDFNKLETEIEKGFVNEATPILERKVLPMVEKSLKVPTFSVLSNESVATQNIQAYSVRTKAVLGLDENLQATTILGNSLNKKGVVEVFNDNPTQTIVNQDNNNNWEVKYAMALTESVKNEFVNTKSKKITQTNENLPLVAQSEKSDESNPRNMVNHNPMNDAVVEEIRYSKPIEMLKNKDFVLVNHESAIPKIIEITINREVKPIRRPVYMSMSFTPLQTYRILTVNNKNIQNLQTNNLFDSERNGFAFDLGITKAIGERWNFRTSISYLKMRQWAEYQVNSEKISVKNANVYANNSAIASKGNEFIGQTRIEAKSLQMVGLKVDVQRFFKISGRNRYFISGGSQLMIEPSEKQTNLFINASAGFQHLVNKDCFLTIEPTASYLLNNINDSKSLIQTNAYNLGLKVGVSFRVK